MKKPPAEPCLFKAILGDSPPFGEAAPDDAVSIGHDLCWSVHPPIGLIRLAEQARAAAGLNRPWADVVEIAEFAEVEVRQLAEAGLAKSMQRYAELFRRAPVIASKFEGMTGADYLAMVGAPTLLAETVIWSVQRLEQIETELPPTPGDTALTGYNILAAYALLLLDRSAMAFSGEAFELAFHLMADAGLALQFATMDKAHFMTARAASRRLLEAEGEINRARTEPASRNRWASRGQTMQEALRLYGLRPYRSARQAAIDIEAKVIAYGETVGFRFAEHNAIDTIAKWIRAHLKPVEPGSNPGT